MALVIVGFLVALVNNFDAFMQGVNRAVSDIFGKYTNGGQLFKKSINS